MAYLHSDYCLGDAGMAVSETEENLAGYVEGQVANDRQGSSPISRHVGPIAPKHVHVQHLQASERLVGRRHRRCVRAGDRQAAREGEREATHDMAYLQPRQLLPEECHCALINLHSCHVRILLEQLSSQCARPRPQFNHLLPVRTVVLQPVHLGREW